MDIRHAVMYASNNGSTIIEAGGPGSGRHKELEDVRSHLLQKGFKVNKDQSTEDGKSVTYTHSDPNLSTEIKQYWKNGIERDWLQVAKYKDGRGGGSRGTSVSLHRRGDD